MKPSFSSILVLEHQFLIDYDITRDIMNANKLRKLRAELNGYKRKLGNIQSRELIGLAESLGRKRSPRGKEPTFISELLPNRHAISIPIHSRALPKGTARSILRDLEQDIDELEAIYYE